MKTTTLILIGILLIITSCSTQECTTFTEVNVCTQIQAIYEVPVNYSVSLDSFIIYYRPATSSDVEDVDIVFVESENVTEPKLLKTECLVQKTRYVCVSE